MIVYLLAIASPTHPVAVDLYYTGWAGQSEAAINYRRSWDGTTDGDRYANGHSYFGIRLDVGVGRGGPLFFTDYSYMGFDPHTLTDIYTNYFENNRNMAPHQSCLLHRESRSSQRLRCKRLGHDCQRWSLGLCGASPRN